MSKILIAGLGAAKNSKDGSYRSTNYKIEDKIYRDRTFITSALEEHYGIDKTFYIGTVGSMWDNIYEHYAKKLGGYDENYHFELLDVTSTATENTPIEKINIEPFKKYFDGKIIPKITKFGVNENEIFENFNIIMSLQDVLEDGDEIYLDITHSFRSNAMWMFLVMNFITDVLDKEIEIKLISYGMFENTNRETGITPVVDLNAFYKLQKWLKGAHAFKNYGNSYTISEMLLEENPNISKKLIGFSDAMNMNYVASIKESVKSLNRIIDEIEEMNGPAKILIPRIAKDFIKEFAEIEEEYMIQAKLAKWHCKQKRYSLACINLNEAVVNFTERALDLDMSKDVQGRKRMAKDLWNRISQRQEKAENILAGSFIKTEDQDKFLKLERCYNTLRKMRNEMAHSLGERKGVAVEIKSIIKYSNEIEELFRDKNYLVDCHYILKTENFFK